MTLVNKSVSIADQVAPQPAYFLSLTIANVKCFGPEQTLDLSDGHGLPARWTVLLGENGVGKTTILQCLAAMEPAMEPAEDKFPDGGNSHRQDIYGTSYKPKGFQEASRRFKFLFERADAAQPAPYGESESTLLIAATVSIGSRFGIASTGMSRQSFQLDGDSSIRHGSAIMDDVSGLAVFGYGATRNSGDIVLANKKTSDRSGTLIDGDATLISAEEWLLQTSYATVIGKMSQKRSAQSRLSNVKNILIQILPDVTDFRFVTSNDTAMKPRVDAKTPYGWVRLSDLSHGYKTAITWIVDLASRLFECFPNSNAPLSEPAVVLIDEIDLHLHPRWQRDLVLNLTETFPNTQFIVTAHSPLIVQAAPDANLALLRREGDYVVIENDVDEIRNWRVDQILTSDLFGLESARSPRLDDASKERERIRAYSNLTPNDEKRLADLDSEIATQTSPGENPLEMRALDALRRAAKLLERDELVTRSAE